MRPLRPTSCLPLLTTSGVTMMRFSQAAWTWRGLPGAGGIAGLRLTDEPVDAQPATRPASRTVEMKRDIPALLQIPLSTIEGLCDQLISVAPPEPASPVAGWDTSAGTPASATAPPALSAASNRCCCELPRAARDYRPGGREAPSPAARAPAAPPLPAPGPS